MSYCIMVDIHNYKRRLERSLERIKEEKILDSNKKLILRFYKHCLAEGLTDGKTHRYIDDLVRISKWLEKDFKSCRKKDIEELIIKIERMEYAEWTKYGFKVLLRKFFKWLRGKDELPREVSWISLKQKNNNHRLPEELLTEQEVKEMINVAEKARDKALIAVLYESGCRISELLNLKIKNITFDTYGAKITVSGKTGSRRIRIIFSVPYLQDWLNKHSQKDDIGSYVFVKRTNEKVEVFSYNRVVAILKGLAKKANIKKKINPHNFRHSRATYLANHLTEAQLKSYFGWTQSSKMAATYVHLSGRDVDKAVLKVYGIKNNENEKEESILIPIECVRCKQINEATNRFCKRCGLTLDEKTRSEVIQEEMKRNQADELMEELVKDKDVLKLLIEKIKGLEKEDKIQK